MDATEKLIAKIESLKVYSAYSDADCEVQIEKDPQGNLILLEDLTEAIEKSKKDKSKRVSDQEKIIQEVKKTFEEMEKIFSSKYLSTQSAINDTNAIIEYAKLKGQLQFKLNKL